MRFGVLGPLEVRTDALAPVAVPGAKERLLLAVLAAASPGVVATDRLVDVLWDGAPPVTARKSLQALRRAGPGDSTSTGDGGCGAHPRGCDPVAEL